jgi:hypothetical protein
MLIQLPPIDFNIASVTMFRRAIAAAPDKPAVWPVLTPKSSMSWNACVAFRRPPYFLIPDGVTSPVPKSAQWGLFHG